MYHKASEGMKVKDKINKHQQKKPWWDNQCKILKSDKNKALRKFRNEGTSNTLQNYKNSANCLKRFVKQSELLIKSRIDRH